jgi:class 3 adenylate cyclase
MNLWKRLILARRKLGILTKFTLAFFALLLLIGSVALTGFVSLNGVQTKTTQAIDTGINTQSLVFQMDEALRNARRLERDFILFWPTIGFSSANQKYVEAHRNEIANVLHISSRLQERLTSPDASAALRETTPDVEDYRNIVEQYSENFEAVVGLVNKLGIENVGVLAKLEQNSTRLNDGFQLADSPELRVLYLEMQALEKEYLSTRQDSQMQRVYEAAQRLRKGILVSSKLSTTVRVQTLKELDAYESVTQEIVALNQQIDSKIRKDIDDDTAKVSQKLSRVARADVEGARSEIDEKIKTATVLVGAALAGAILVALLVAKQFFSALNALAEEQRKSDRLLRNILPGPIAQELKRQERTIADSFPEVTVMFADIVGFTELAAQTDPIELVEILNVIFSEFDQLTEEHGLEKIKTIGDAYMVVGGLPAAKPNHAEAIAAMALDIQSIISEYCQDTGQSLSIRVGINTGPVIAGIIGTKKFIYDLWGDTVNIASRMESHGIPGCIQVTEATYQRLKSQYLFEERGPVQVKGRGEMNCYLLKGKKI